MRRALTKTIIFALSLLAFAVITRLIPHPPNMTALGATALIGGIYFPKRFAIPFTLVALLLSDLVIGFYSWQIMASVYLGFILMTLLGSKIKNKTSGSVLGGTLVGSLLFFLITNAAVWFFGSMYAPGISGLIQSYIAALPFFQNSLAGNAIYAVTLFAVAERCFAFSFETDCRTSPLSRGTTGG